ncbi:hypothetical protein [Litoribacillus peritrichatus]|uniref:Uncharacterized protein n=1 Tax=Litoribacillus peritrichatus TaxID=718191 RepID=A0ABP7NAY6_9GAMM
MSKITIAQATNLLDEFILVLEDTYWEATQLSVKDEVFALIRLLSAELTELQKVSVQDDHYDYEVISTKPSVIRDGVKSAQENVLPTVLRVQTKQKLLPLFDASLEAFS